MFAFAAAVLFLILTPGPGVLSTAGVSAGFGVRPATHYVFGLWIGNNLVALAVVSGLAAAMLAQPLLRNVLLFASVLYLLYLAARIAFAGSRIAFIERARPPGIPGGVLLQVVNPKAYAVHTTLFSGFAFDPANPLAEAVVKFVIMNAIWIPIHFVWLGAGIWLNRLDLAPRTHRVINIFMAMAMLAVVALAATSSR